MLLHGAGSARARLSATSGTACRSAWRPCRSRSATSAPAFRASTGTRARRSRSNATPNWSALLKELLARAASRSRCTATRTRTFRTASSFRRRPIPSGACVKAWRICGRRSGADISVFVPPHNALSKRGLAAVGAAGLNILGSFLSFRPSMRPVGPAHAGELVARAARFARRSAARGAIASSTRTCCATRATPSSAATA